MFSGLRIRFRLGTQIEEKQRSTRCWSIRRFIRDLPFLPCSMFVFPKTWNASDGRFPALACMCFTCPYPFEDSPQILCFHACLTECKRKHHCPKHPLLNGSSSSGENKKRIEKDLKRGSQQLLPMTKGKVKRLNPSPSPPNSCMATHTRSRPKLQC